MVLNTGRKLLVGIDEAGYGPNLGPLVVSAAWLEVPAETASPSLWDTLAPDVSRYPPAERAKVVIDDSKRVYPAPDGWRHLERTVLAWLGLHCPSALTLRGLWQGHCLTPMEDLDESPWYTEQDRMLPRALDPGDGELARTSLSSALARAGYCNAGLACQIIMPRRFNALLRQFGSKSGALFQVNSGLLRHIWNSSGQSQLEILLDKHGGRNFYRPLLQQEFHETLVLVGHEGAAQSRYCVAVGGRRLDVCFLPRADSEHLLVALASMAAKYIRELWMELFNEYWSQRIPGLRPTAGYPTDAKRFWKAIRPISHGLGIARELLWRER
jgi:ribonuclease HII